MRRYSAWRDSPRSAAAWLTTPRACASAASIASRLGLVEAARGRGAPAPPAGRDRRRDRLAAGQQRGALDRVLQLAHVARPRMRAAARRARRRRARAAVQEVFGQRQDVVAALGQRRQAHLDHVEPVVQILAEACRRGSSPCRSALVALITRTLALARAGWSRGARTARFRARAAASSGRPAAGCRSRRGTACRRRPASKRPSRALFGAGVRAGFGAEQLGLDQLGRQRAAVDARRKARAARPSSPARSPRCAPCRLPLGPVISTGTSARATWQASSSARSRRGRTRTRGRPDRNCAASASRRARRSRARRATSRVGLGQLQQVLHRGQQLVVVPGLGEVVGRAGLDQLDRGLQVRPRGQQHHRQVRMALADRAEQRDAFLARRGVGAEVHVLDHQVDALALQQRQALARA